MDVEQGTPGRKWLAAVALLVAMTAGLGWSLAEQSFRDAQERGRREASRTWHERPGATVAAEADGGAAAVLSGATLWE
jgi:hypothetical protein